MHYVIIGAGAVGGAIGAKLHQHGHRVTLVARGAHLAAIRERGLLLATPEGEQLCEIPVVAGPDALSGAGASPRGGSGGSGLGGEVALEPDCALVFTVKSQDTRAALAAWVDAPVRGGGVAGDRLPVLCAQNGVANERLALRLFAQVYAVCVWLPATFLEPGTVVAESHPYPGMLQLGGYPGGLDETVHAAAADLAGSGFLTRARDDAMRWKYGKLLSNLGNGLDALFGSRDQELYARVRAEGEAVLATAGIAHTSREEEAAERGDRIRIQPVAGRERGGSSTWQSLARGTDSVEIDYLNGEIVLLGREHGVPTPVNLAVQRAVHRAVRTGSAPGQFPADEFRALIS